MVPHATALQRQIADLLHDNRLGGLTCDEIERKLHLSHQTASARVRELYLADQIIHHGTRPTRSGRQARVYFPHPKPKESK